jgi:hypothetical protein
MKDRGISGPPAVEEYLRLYPGLASSQILAAPIVASLAPEVESQRTVHPLEGFGLLS